MLDLSFDGLFAVLAGTVYYYLWAVSFLRRLGCVSRALRLLSELSFPM